MRQIKAREIKTIALHTYKPSWNKNGKGMTFKNYYRKLKDEYIRGNYAK